MRNRLKPLFVLLGTIAVIAIIVFWILFELDLLGRGIFWFLGIIAAIIVEVFFEVIAEGDSTDSSSENTNNSETQKETKIQDKKEYKEPWEK